MTYDPNLPPASRDRLRDPDPVVERSRSGSVGWMIGLLILALIVIGAFFVYPSRTSNVAGNDPGATGTTRTTPPPAPSLPAPAAPAPSPAPAAPAAPR